MLSMKDVKSLGDSIGSYVFETFVKPRMAHCVRYYRAEVTAAAENGKITVRRPFDNPVSLPYVGSAAALTAGSQCLVLVLGGDSNAIVLGDGKLSNL